jgi:hypothetical protein
LEGDEVLQEMVDPGTDGQRQGQRVVDLGGQAGIEIEGQGVGVGGSLETGQTGLRIVALTRPAEPSLSVISVSAQPNGRHAGPGGPCGPIL